VDVPPARLPVELADIIHCADFGGLITPVSRGRGPAETAAVLAVSIECKPFAVEDEPDVPVVNIQVADDLWIRNLDPAEVSDLGQRLGALAHQLILTVAPALAAAREDWTQRQPVPDATSRKRQRPTKLDHEPKAVTWARQKAGLTKRQLAELVGISEQLMGEIESGWRNATPANLIKLAEVLKCPLVTLERKRG
jgi:DNA-binding XRE family transcriptional regulator